MKKLGLRGWWIAAALLAGGSWITAIQASGSVELISQSPTGQPMVANDTAISGDGRFVAFTAYGDDIVPNDTNGISDIFLRDRVTGTMERVSVTNSGAQATGDYGSIYPSLSANGRFVAFQSHADNLVPGDTNHTDDIFVRDRLNGTTERVSVSSIGTGGNSYSSAPQISADGRYVVYYSGATNLVPGDTNDAADVFLRDRVAGTTERVNVDASGNQTVLSTEYYQRPGISDDGRYVVFSMEDGTLVPNDTNGNRDIYLKDRTTGQLTRISNTPGGAAGNSQSIAPSISGDGRFIAFVSFAGNLLGNSPPQGKQIFLLDRQTGILTQPSVGQSLAASVPAQIELGPGLSANGRYLTWITELTGDVFGLNVTVYDRVTGSSTPVCYRESQYVYWPAISGNGRWISFLSSASDLVPNDTNNAWDVFAAGNPLFAPETVLPVCLNTASRPGPPAQVDVTVQDTGSGIAAIQATIAENCTITIPPFTPGTNAALVVTATKTNPSLKARVALRVTDVSGNVLDCDPVIAELTIPKGKRRLVRTFSGVPAGEHYLRVENGTPGLTGLAVTVNGKGVGELALTPGSTGRLSFPGALRTGKRNTVRVVATGAPGAKALLLLGDVTLAGGPAALRSAEAWTVNLEWGP